MKKLWALVCLSIFFLAQAVYPQGRNPLDEVLSAMDTAFAEADTEFTARDEYYLGRAAAAALLSRYRPYTANPELTKYLNKICRTIAINSPRPEIYNGYYVMILDSREYNAFATPGGHILITKALVEAVSSEDALAGIIAHEMAHIQLKHGIALVESVIFNERMSAVAERAADMAGGPNRITDFRNSVTALIDTMLLNGYSQTQEFEADSQAAALLSAAGYDPGAFMEVLNILRQVQGTQQGGFNSTHPSPARRITHLENAINRYPVRDTRSYRIPRFRKQVKSEK